MLTPRGVPAAGPAAAVVAARHWRRAAAQMVRRNLLPWLAVKGALIGLVFLGQMGVWTAFVVDTAVAAAVIVYGWRLARRPL